MSVLQRRHLIELQLRTRGASTQEHLAESLKKQGLQVTQATISRDLSAIGAVKTPTGYRLSEDLTGENPRRGPNLSTTLSSHAITITHAASLVVLRTAPGHAGVIGDALDSSDLKDAIGTIAGDDTIFIATPSNAAASRLTKKLTSVMTKGGASK